MTIKKEKVTSSLTVRIKKWGNGCGILLPKKILNLLSLKECDSLEMSIEEEKIILTPYKKKHRTLEERFKDFEGEPIIEEYWSDFPVGKEFI